MKAIPIKNHYFHAMPADSLYKMILAGALAIPFLPFLIKTLRIRYIKKKTNRLYADKQFVFDNILQGYNPYYKSLDARNRERFLKRVITFMETKEFRYVDLAGTEQMPLLISAAAVQLTFGLSHYLLDYFTTIYVLKDNYRYGTYNIPFEGHVSEDGIYLSWNNFIRQFSDYTDGQNVGLHEMAHALTYVNFTVREGEDDSFRKKFYDFSPVARPVFQRMQAGEITLLNQYAASSYEEFWAVCIETFFERPAAFREQLPDLYFALCNLLNQDPLTAEKVLYISEIA